MKKNGLSPVSSHWAKKNTETRGLFGCWKLNPEYPHRNSDGRTVEYKCKWACAAHCIRDYEYFMYSFFSSIGNRISDLAEPLSVRLNSVMKIVAVFIRFLKSF
jgi:hypothetical protein